MNAILHKTTILKFLEMLSSVKLCWIGQSPYMTDTCRRIWNLCSRQPMGRLKLQSTAILLLRDVKVIVIAQVMALNTFGVSSVSNRQSHWTESL